VADLAAGRWAHVVLDAPATGHALAMLRAPRTYAAATRAGPVAAGARDVAALLADPARTAIVLVTAPEELAVTESAAFREGLRDATGRDADLLVVNRRLASPFAEDEAAALRGITGDSVADSALWLHEAAAAQDGQVGRLDTELGGLPRAALPFWFCAHPGTHELDDAVARLEAVL
jgi:anion-transporting  ArsA/GET3 family ATPase